MDYFTPTSGEIAQITTSDNTKRIRELEERVSYLERELMLRLRNEGVRQPSPQN